MVREQRKRLLLTGTCWYELTGLQVLLTRMGYDVFCAPVGYFYDREGWDLAVVALSAEPLIAWRRHVSWIREIKQWLSCELVALVPRSMKRLNILQDICRVCDGHESLYQLRAFLSPERRPEGRGAGSYERT